MEIPHFLFEMLIAQYGKEITNKIIEGYNKKRCVSFRINTLKTTVDKIKEKLEENKIQYKEVNWSKEALIIKNVDEKELRELEIYKNGEIYMQSLSSMLPPIILEPKEDTDILDMCAAPGGKTTRNCNFNK